MIAGLPLTSGPVSAFLAVERGKEFAASAAGATALGLMTVVTFVLAYAWASRVWCAPICVALGLAACAAATWSLARVPQPPALIVLFPFASILLALWWLPTCAAKPQRTRRPRCDILLRAAVATAIVAAITGAAASLGPKLAGLLSPFPAFACVMAVFSHISSGPDHAVSALRGVLQGSFAFLSFFLIVWLMLSNAGVVLAYGMAVMGAGLTQFVVSALAWRVEGRT